MKALIITGKYAQDIEVFYPLYRMQEEGWDVDIVTPDNKECLGVYGMKIVPTREMPKNSPVDMEYSVLVLPGGARALEYLRQDQEVILTIRRFLTWHSDTGIIAAICHGAQLLIEADIVRGRRISGYYSIKKDIQNAGGIFVDAPFVSADKFVTCPHYKYMGPWMKEVIAKAYYYHDAKSV